MEENQLVIIFGIQYCEYHLRNFHFADIPRIRSLYVSKALVSDLLGLPITLLTFLGELFKGWLELPFIPSNFYPHNLFPILFVILSNELTPLSWKSPTNHNRKNINPAKERIPSKYLSANGKPLKYQK